MVYLKSHLEDWIYMYLTDFSSAHNFNIFRFHFLYTRSLWSWGLLLKERVFFSMSKILPLRANKNKLTDLSVLQVYQFPFNNVLAEKLSDFLLLLHLETHDQRLLRCPRILLVLVLNFAFQIFLDWCFCIL